jgi:plasmid stability protein
MHCMQIRKAGVMTILTVRNLSPETHRKLKQRAAARGRSMEAEARAILDETVLREDEPVDVIAALRDFALDCELTDAEVDLIFKDRPKPLPRVVDFGADE